MNRPVDPKTTNTPRQLALWFGLLGGAAAWFAHLVIAYSLVPLACARDMDLLLYATIPGTGVIAAAAVFVAWRDWRRFGTSPDDANGPMPEFDRVRFMALSGLAMSGFFLIVIIVQSVPIIMNSPCDPAGSIRI